MKNRKQIEKELQEKLDRTNKRFALVCSSIAFILAIPFCCIIFMKLLPISDFMVMIMYLSSVCISLLFAPKIAQLIYKDLYK